MVNSQYQKGGTGDGTRVLEFHSISTRCYADFAGPILRIIIVDGFSESVRIGGAVACHSTVAGHPEGHVCSVLSNSHTLLSE